MLDEFNEEAFDEGDEEEEEEEGEEGEEETDKNAEGAPKKDNAPSKKKRED